MIPRVLALAVTLVLCACGDSPQLGTTAHEIVYVSPASHDFGALPVGATTSPRTIVVGVSGSFNESHTITSITESCADFSLDLSNVFFPAEIYRFCETCTNCAQPAICEIQTQQFDVYFTPSIAGPQACSITVQYESGSRVVNVMGTGVAPAYDITLLSPPGGVLAFGDVVVGQPSSTLSILVRSDGTMPLEISSADFNGTGDPSQFSVSPLGPITLSPGATHQINVSCLPTAPGPTGAGFAIQSNDPQQPLVLINFSCNGIQSNLVVNPSPALFPETFIGSTTPLTIQLLNTGAAPMVVESITVTPSQFTFDPLADPNIPAAGAAGLPVYFAADESVVDQDVQGMLTVTYDGGQTRSIDLIGPARSAVLSITPGGEVNFGTVCAGQSRPQIFAAINLGSGQFSLTDALVAGDGFTLTAAPPLPTPLPARGGATAAFEVTAMPADGDVTGTLTFLASAPNLPAVTVTLLAHGQTGGVGANPISVDFDAVVVDTPSGGRAVTLSNCDPAPLAVTSATVTGVDAADFTAVTTFALPGSIPAFGNATWLVELTPTSPGEKSAALTITHASGTTSIPLTGTAVETTQDEGRGSYYACHTSRPAGLLPILLAFLFLLRRRCKP